MNRQITTDFTWFYVNLVVVACLGLVDVRDVRQTLSRLETWHALSDFIIFYVDSIVYVQ